MSATRELTRHFVANTAGRAWLDEEGIEAMRGVFFSALAGLAAVGFILPRGFHKRYTDLSALSQPGPYREALMADSLFMIALPALLTALVAILLAPAMFPDETDYVALAPLPLKRRQIFVAKFAALVTIVGALVGGVTLLFSITFPGFTHGPWAESGLFARIGAHALASAACSVCAFLTVVCIQGAVLMITPSRVLRPVSAAVQCGLLVLLILALPLVFRMPALSAWIAGQPPELRLLPPAWFLGVEQMALGRTDPFLVQLAAIGLAALACTILLTAVCYLIRYRKVEGLVTPVDRARAQAPWRISRHARARRSAPWRAVWEFSTATLARNRLSQMLFLTAWAAGGAIVLDTLLDAAPRQFARETMTMPLVLMVTGTLGLRAAFLLPVNSRANWIFRQMDFPSARSGHLAAVDRAFRWLAIAPALAVSAPIQIYTLGVRTTAGSWLLTSLVGLLLVEIVLVRWRRVPFTCTWLPGKRPLPLLVLWTIGALIVLSGLSEAIRVALRSPGGFLIMTGLLLTLVAAARYRRQRTWAAHPLQFEDERPDQVQTLGLVHTLH